MKHISIKLRPVVIALGLLGLSGCSSLSGLMGEDERDYRHDEKQLAKNLEMPPNLFHPSKKQNQMEFVLDSKLSTDMPKKDTIPTYQAEGVSVKANLSERWLELDTTNSQHVWSGLKNFFNAMGMGIKEERTDIGVLKTDFSKRTEIVPLQDVGLLTRALNSWRPELAEGIYDRFVARVEADEAQGVTRVYFHHHMVYSPDTNEQISGEDRWRIKPYNPLMESEALYQAMVFFGSNSEVALAQISATGQLTEMFEGQQELKGLILKASISESWSYLQSMVYRANWQVISADATLRSMWVKVPESNQGEQSFWSKLAFWKDSDEPKLPAKVLLSLSEMEGAQIQTLLSTNVEEGQPPLDGQQREHLFKKLGLIGQ